MTVGERIKEIRTKLGISQVDFADKINVSKQTLYKYENNIITNIPSDKIEAAARIGNVPPAYLMGWSDDDDIDIFEELLATTDWYYESYSHCDENPNCPLSDDDKVDMWVNDKVFDACDHCSYNSPYYYLTNGNDYYKLEEDEFNELSSCLRPYLLFRINETISKKNALSKHEYELEEGCVSQKDYEDEFELLAAHERTDIEVTDEMRKHDDDIMSDENF